MGSTLCRHVFVMIVTVVSEQMMFEEFGRTDGRQTTDEGAWLYYKLTFEPKGSGELLIIKSNYQPEFKNNIVLIFQYIYKSFLVFSIYTYTYIQTHTCI